MYQMSDLVGIVVRIDRPVYPLRQPEPRHARSELRLRQATGQSGHCSTKRGRNNDLRPNTTTLREDVVVARRGMVMGDDCRQVGQERCQVVDATAHSVAVVAAIPTAAGGAVVLNRCVVDRGTP